MTALGTVSALRPLSNGPYHQTTKASSSASGESVREKVVVRLKLIIYAPSAGLNRDKLLVYLRRLAKALERAKQDAGCARRI
jgi:hypothetical protein